MDRQGDASYEDRFKTVRHESRNREDHEREPDNPIYDNYKETSPEFIQDVEFVDPRGRFSTHRGKNDITVDLVLTGRVFTEEFDKSGRPQRVLAPFGLSDMPHDSVTTGQRTADEKSYVKTDDVDNFHTEWAKRVAETERINREKLEALGYELLERGDDGYKFKLIMIHDLLKHSLIFLIYQKFYLLAVWMVVEEEIIFQNTMW